MFSRYDVERLDDGTGYKFITDSGDIYFAYFTEFFLLDPSENEVQVVSFGFTCQRANDKSHPRYDEKVKQTIIHLINGFFHTENENAILYMCANSDGKARNRNVVFNKWYNEVNEDIEKHSSSSEHGKQGFYAAILFRSNNPYKQRLIDSFYFTINYWGLNNE